MSRLVSQIIEQSDYNSVYLFFRGKGGAGRVWNGVRFEEICLDTIYTAKDNVTEVSSGESA